MLRCFALAALVLLPTLVSAQTVRTVLLEQFTGTWCRWCPYGADSVASILNYVPNSRALAYHNGDPMATAETNTLIQHLMVSSYPGAAIDRMLITIGSTSSISISRIYWGQVTAARAQQSSPLSMSVTGTYHQDTREIDVTVTLNILQEMNGEFYLTGVLSEDDLNYPQIKNVGGTDITLDPYYHKRVVRKMLPHTYGKTIATSGLAAHQVVTENFTYTVPANWDISKCKLTFLVTTKVTLNVNNQPRIFNMAIQQAWQEQLTTALAVIPVELVSFNGTQIDDGVRLEWRTATESNNRGWFVERRHPDAAWSEIGFVQGYGTTTQNQQYEFVDRDTRIGGTYDYRLRQIDFDGSMEYSPIFRIMLTPVPTLTRLLPNYPNPFNPSTSIVVELAEESEMLLAVYDMLGRLVKQLASGVHSAGGHVFEWNGSDENGHPVEAGIYITRLITPTFSATRQMQLLK